MKKKLKKRPTEVLTGAPFGLVVYGYLAEQGVPNGIAVVAGAICAFAPTFVSNIVDAVRR